MDTSNVSEDLRSYIPLLLESILVCPVNRNGKLIPYEEIVAELESDTIGVKSGLGLENSCRFSCGTFSQAANVMIQVNYLIFKIELILRDSNCRNSNWNHNNLIFFIFIIKSQCNIF